MPTDANKKQLSTAFNKPVYILFVTVGTYFLIKRDFSNATIFWGLALVFDPFNVQVSFNNDHYTKEFGFYCML